MAPLHHDRCLREEAALTAVRSAPVCLSALRCAVLPLALSGCGAPAEPSGTLALVVARDGDFEIATMDVGEPTVRVVAPSPGLDYLPGWTPDGRAILFYSDRDGSWDVYRMEDDGADPVNLSNHPARDFNPAAGPDGRIAFVSDRDGDRELFVMGPDGSDVRQLTENDWLDDMPSWSPDGRTIAYAAAPDGGDADVYLLDVETGRSTALAVRPGFDSSPSFSPDGTHVAFYGTHGDSASIFVADVASGGVTRVPNGVRDERHPRWSPDGRWLVVTGTDDQSADPDTDIWLLRPDGSGRRRLTHDPGRQEYAVWRPR